ncbi:hypothetical protein B7435_07915 [Mycolicibacterium peregrinum]|nr:hypothetical protein B7435_07915 [Mycolicibacterium peregrinum]
MTGALGPATGKPAGGAAGAGTAMTGAGGATTGAGATGAAGAAITGAGAAGILGGVDRMTIVRLLGAVGTGARPGARPRLPLVGAPAAPPPPPPPDTTADGAWPVPPVTAAAGAWAVPPDRIADGAWPVVPTRADCGDSANVPERAAVAGASPAPTVVAPVLVAAESVVAVLVAPVLVVPTFDSGLEPLEPRGPPRLPPEFLTPPPRCGPNLAAAGPDFLFFFLWSKRSWMSIPNRCAEATPVPVMPGPTTMAPHAIAQPAAVLRTHDRSTSRSPPKRDRRHDGRAHWNKFPL